MDQSTAAYAFHPTERATDALAPCMKCPVTIHTPEYHFRFSVLVYSLETETSGNKKCSKNRLDIFNGKKNDQEYLLSGILAFTETAFQLQFCFTVYPGTVL